MKKRILLVIPVILILIASPAVSYGIHKPETVKWQLVYLTGNPTCSNYDYQMTNVYDEISEKYMTWYQLENSKDKPLCISVEKLSKSNIPTNLDLLILVYEKNIGRNDLNSNGVGGVYFHAGGYKDTNHVIIFCDCPNFEYSDPVWILSHELSHFILYYKGYGPDIVEDMIHNIDSKYDYCIESHQPDLCKDVKAYLRVDSQAYNRVVIPPYQSEEKAESNNLPTLNFMQKQVTSFWIDGKISDTDYLTAMGYDVEHLIGKTEQKSDAYFDGKKLFTDGPKDKKMNTMLHDGEVSLRQDQIDTILENVPSKFFESKTDVNVDDINIPQWYKKTAELWLDRKINDASYFNGIDYLFKIAKSSLAT